MYFINTYSQTIEATKIFSISLKKELELEVKGSLYIEPLGDNLNITIHTPIGKVYRYTEYNIYEKIVHGITPKTLALKIVKSYKNFINFQFFVK